MHRQRTSSDATYREGTNPRETRELSVASDFASEMSLDFAGRMDQLAERELSELLSQLWLGVRSETRVRDALTSPRTNWNPYRPARGGANIRREILNSQIAEFESFVHINTLYVRGAQIVNPHPPKGERSKSLEQMARTSLSNSLFPSADYRCCHIPEEKEVRQLQVNGTAASIRKPTRADTTEEILVQDGAQLVEVFAVDRSGGEPPKAADGKDTLLEPAEQLQAEMVDCVFRDVWTKVVVPHYVKLLGEEKDAADSSPTDEVQFLCAEGRPASVRHNSLTGSTNPSPTHRPRPTTGPANMRKESLVSQPSSAGAALTRHQTDDDTVLMKGKRKKKERKGVNPTETLVELEAKGETEAFLPARRGYRHNSDSHNTLNSGNTSVRHSTIMFAEDLEQSPPDAKNTKNNSNSASPASPFREKEATPIRTSSANNRSVLATNRAETAGQMAAVYGIKPKKKRKKVTSESGKNTLNRKPSKKGKPPVSPPEDGGGEIKPQSAAGARPPRSDGHSSPLQSGRRYKELVPMEVPPTKPGSGPDLEPTPPVGITPGSLLAPRTVSGRTRRLEPLTKKAE